MRALLISDKDAQSTLSNDLRDRLRVLLVDRGFEVEAVEVGDAEIVPCTGCLRCHLQANGVCPYVDALTPLNANIAHIDLVCLLGPIAFGQFGATMKSVADKPQCFRMRNRFVIAIGYGRHSPHCGGAGGRTRLSRGDVAGLERCGSGGLACPLYGYCLPGGLVRFLEAWARYGRQHPQDRGARFYALVNCGFVVPETMSEALRVIDHFCGRLGLEHRFSVAIASGLVAVITEPIDFRLKRAYTAIGADIQSESHEPRPHLFLEPLIPRIVMDSSREYLDARVQRDVRKGVRRAVRGLPPPASAAQSARAAASSWASTGLIRCR